MFESVRKHPGVWFLIAFSATVAWLVETIGGLEELARRWETWSPTIIPLARVLGPWLWHGLLLYYLTGLIFVLYGKWQERKSLHKKRRQEEIREIKDQIRVVGLLAMECTRQQKKLSPPAEAAINKLTQILVKSAVYEYRLELYNRVQWLKTNPSSKALDRLLEWESYAEQEANGDPPLLKDPLRRPTPPEGKELPPLPDPHGVNKYLFPPKDQ